MKVEFSTSILGFTVGGHSYTKEIEIDDEDLIGMKEEEVERYIEEQVYDYIIESLDYCYEVKE